MSESKSRKAHDSLGEVEVPASALYGAQTQRAVNNFKLSGLQMPHRFINTVVQIKKAAAQVNADLGILEEDKEKAIVAAADELLGNDYRDQFPVDVFQTGSGTSTNMNVNEVIVGLCKRMFDVNLHPNDHVNLGQSSNDVIPTAIQVSAATAINNELVPAFRRLITNIDQKAAQYRHVIKNGRTHLMDAMPVSFAQEFSAWSSQLDAGINAVEQSRSALTRLAQGGTAVGTGVNTHAEFAPRFARQLSDNLATGEEWKFSPSDNFFSSISAQDSSVAVSGSLRVLATAVYKISNDLRWMNSGPLSGLSEVSLRALQPGSSIMPGKVNPVIPEAICMACAQVTGNDATIAMAGMSGNFQLNTMLPVIAHNLLQSIELLTNSASHLDLLTIQHLEVNQERVAETVAKNPMLATALAPLIGYDAAAKVAKLAHERNQSVLEVAQQETDLTEAQLQELLNPQKLINQDS